MKYEVADSGEQLEELIDPATEQSQRPPAIAGVAILVLVAFALSLVVIVSQIPAFGLHNRDASLACLGNEDGSLAAPTGAASPGRIEFSKLHPIAPQEYNFTAATSMTVLSPLPDYASGMELSAKLFGASRTTFTGTYDEPLLFHAFWDGPLLAKHLVSVQSCYAMHFRGPHNNTRIRRIVLWVVDAAFTKTDPVILEQFQAMSEVEMRIIDLATESQGSPFFNTPFLKPEASIGPSYFSDVVRYILLYKYGGVWFDLDVLWLRPIDPLLIMFKTKMMVYTWENQNYPNGAVFISLYPRSPEITHLIDFLIERKRGFGFQESGLEFSLPIHLLVLPCAWFDAGWQPNPISPISSGESANALFTSRPASLPRCTFDNFHATAFTYHWHNRWGNPIVNTSCFADLRDDVVRMLAM